MKSRRLTETDIANMSFQPTEVKRKKLVGIAKPKPISGSYEPFRSSAGDAVNQQFPFFGEERPATSLDVLERVVAKSCKGDSLLLSMNLNVARATHKFASEAELTAERADIRSIALAFGHSYQFGLPLIMRHAGEAYAVFPDLRRTTPLSTTGCRFIFSAMHQRWRVNYPDLADMGLSIWRYANNDARDVREIRCNNADLISYDALLNDVKQTYDILHSVLNEDENNRRHIVNEPGPLFAVR